MSTLFKKNITFFSFFCINHTNSILYNDIELFIQNLTHDTLTKLSKKTLYLRNNPSFFQDQGQ